MRHLDFRGHRVAYEQAGEGPPIVLLHNGGTCHRIWQRQIEALAPRFTCYALDLPGFGESAGAGPDWRMGDLVAMARAFVEERRLERCAWVGNCMGSAIALTLALETPELVERLALFNVLTRETLLAGRLGPLVRLAEAMPGGAATFRALFGWIRLPAAAARLAVRSQLAHAARSPELAAHLASLYRQAEQTRALLSVAVDLPAYARLDTASLPAGFPETIVLWGRDNRILPLAAGRPLCERLALPLEVVEGGHLVMYEAAEAVNPRLKEFLGGAERGRAGVG